MKKALFWGNKTVDQSLGANLKNLFFFAKFYSKFATSLHFFSLLAQKMLKMAILTSVWGMQHPNAGQNIQQPDFYLIQPTLQLQPLSN